MAVNDGSVTILAERPDSEEAVKLIGELEDTLDPLYPSESRHGFSVEKLIAEKVAFFILRYEGTPAGCGGIKLFGRDYGELKRIFVRSQYRGKGLSKLIMCSGPINLDTSLITRSRYKSGSCKVRRKKD